MAIAHRGASAYAPDNTLRAFELAADLDADMWEVDIQVSRDGIPVVCHDADLRATAGRSERLDHFTSSELVRMDTRSGEPIPLFAEVVDLAKSRGAALYLDVKDLAAAEATFAILDECKFEKAIFGTTDPDFCRQLKSQNCPYPVSILIGLGKDAFELADISGADIIHPCWERASDRPDRLLDADFFDQASARGLPIVTWHEERPDVARTLCEMPVLGICSDTPELLKPYRKVFPDAPLVVCHRGANAIAPENTLVAANAAFAAGYDFVELDVRKTADDTLAVIHDRTVGRTTNGSGAVADLATSELLKLDAGSWHSRHFSGTRIPQLADMIDCAKSWSRQLYIELKDANPNAVVALVAASAFMDNCFFWSFDKDNLRMIRDHHPDAKLMARLEDYASLEECLQDLRPNIVEFNTSNACANDFARVRSVGGRVMVAYMGNNPGSMKNMLSLQPDMVNINDTIGWRKIVSSQ
ncbi:MAG: glycerophosphodiester phosphodiesterase family protein [Roseibium sp.]|uniref:glycerophosphodiester phosphodiesterase n=1 Tax=Roseibium sp. TaxID=1936156 RepID=UPI00329903B9